MNEYVMLAGRAITSYGSPKERKFMGIICYSSCVFNWKSATQADTKHVLRVPNV